MDRLDIKCEKCQKPLKSRNKAVWLEFDQRTNTYTHEPVPEEYSQGGFPFGRDCAKIVLAEDKRRRALTITIP